MPEMNQKPENNQKPQTQLQKISDIHPETVRQIRDAQTVHCLRMLMASMKIRPDQAMALLQIPTKQRKSFRAILTNLKDQKRPKKAKQGGGHD